MRLSQRLPKSVPLLVRAVFGGRHHRSSSHRQSIFHFQFVFSHTPGFHSLITCCVFNPLFPPCLCAELFIVSACAHDDRCAKGFLYSCLVTLYAVGFAIKLLRLLLSSALLRQTSLPRVTQPLHLSNQIKCIYIALRTSADVSKCCTETQPKTPNSKQCRCRSIFFIVNHNICIVDCQEDVN